MFTGKEKIGTIGGNAVYYDASSYLYTPYIREQLDKYKREMMITEKELCALLGVSEMYFRTKVPGGRFLLPKIIRKMIEIGIVIDQDKLVMKKELLSVA